MNCPVCGGSNWYQDENGWRVCREKHAGYNERLLPGGVTVHPTQVILPTGEDWWEIAWHPYLHDQQTSEEYGCVT